MAYMLPHGPYDVYILSHTTEDNITTCVGFSALAKVNTRFSKGLCFTGVRAVSCGHSKMLLPNATGNPQKGERYSAMEYIFRSSLQSMTMFLIDASYDISCQWFPNLEQCSIEQWPVDLELCPGLQLWPLVPKLHELGYQQVGHEQFSFNFTPDLGLIDDEYPEHI